MFKGQRKEACGAKLVKEVLVKSGSNFTSQFYPIKVYCFNSIINQLEQMLKRPGFAKRCEEWRQRETEEDFFSDVYDGKIWKSFKWSDGSWFFGKERRYAMMMNVDWFQPFKRRSDYSVGVIYFVLMNLPRSERFKFENVIIAGIVPNFDKEPGLNTFLEPVVDELNALWKGLSLRSSLTPVPLKIVAALLCVASDVPAARKACGFKSHSANLGCSKCYKLFPGGFAVKKDYSGYNRTTWTKRSKEKHNRHSVKLLDCSTRKQYEEKAKQYGIHYSILTKLDYFDAVRFHIIDPMHNLFLGIAKKTWKLWMENVFSKQDLVKINKKIEQMNIASDVGRIGSNISSNYGNFTAQEWKNWTTIQSLYVLSGILPQSHLQLWERFVLACRLLCHPIITSTDIKKADVLLLNFCKGFEQLYGKTTTTPNMHLCCHLQESILDYGPIYGFWLFSFERYNGELGSMVTNNRSVEIQYMRKFVTASFVNPQNGHVPVAYYNDFEDFFNKDNNPKINAGHQRNSLSLYLMSVRRSVEKIAWDMISHISLPNAYIEDCLDEDDRSCLAQVYNILYPGMNVTPQDLPFLVKKYKHLHIGQEKYGSQAESRTQRSAHVMASWLCEDNTIDISKATLRPALVDCFFSHQLIINGKATDFIFARVRWYRKVCTNSTTSHRDLWKDKDYEIGGVTSFLPVHRLHCRIALGYVKTGPNRYFMACPMNRKICA